MNRETAYVLWFDELKREDVNLVGGKSSSLGELTSSTNVPVPYGFATTAYGYREFMKETGLEDRIRQELDDLSPPLRSRYSLDLKSLKRTTT